MRHLRLRRPAALLFAIGLSLFGVAAIATAHAELVTPTPADGATVEGTPPEISGVYSEPMKVEGSSLFLTDATGKEVGFGGVLADDAKRMEISPVPDLAPGTYTVKSTTTSAADGDIDRKEWTFTVVAAALSTPTPTPAASASIAPSEAPSVVPSAAASAVPTAVPASVAPTPASTSAASADGSSGSGSGGDVLLPILAAVVILVVIGGYLYSRRDRSTPTQP